MTKKAYIGTKIIMAEPGPAPRDMGNHERGTPGMVVHYPDGYTSWSPYSVFFAAYRPVTSAEAELINPPEVAELADPAAAGPETPPEPQS